MAWADFKRTDGWDVTGLGQGGTNPWDLKIGDNLTFHEDAGGNPDVLKKTDSGGTTTPIGSNCTYFSSDDRVEVKYEGDGTWYAVRRSGTLNCKPRSSGSLSWSAAEG